MHRFFVEEDQIGPEEIVIIGEDVKHISGALRLEVGQKIEVACQGQVYLAEISSMDKKEVVLNRLDQYEGKNEPKTKLTLYQGLAKGSRMDYIIQKGTEVGISQFVIVETDRSVARLVGDKKKEAKLDRWQKVADEAAKQSKRDLIPKVRDIISFKQMLEELKSSQLTIIPYEENLGQGLKDLLRSHKNEAMENLAIIIGPEGGFEAKEVQAVVEAGGHSVSLGPRILRTETAGLVAASMVFYELEDI